MTTALVLSGGGARGDFEVGAVRYLYERVWPNGRPDVVCGTSVGAINAAKLAEGQGGLDGLEAIWRGLRSDEDMYVPEQWLADVKNSDVVKFLQESTAQQVAEALATLSNPVELVIGTIDAAEDIADLASAVSDGMHDASLYNLGPIGARLRDPACLDPGKVAGSGIRLRLAIVGLASGRLCWVTETGDVLERDGSARTVAALAPECQAIATRIAGLVSDIREQQAGLHDAVSKGAAIMAIHRLNEQYLQACRELEACTAAHPPAPSPVRVTLADAVLASASIPGVFPPVRLADDWYVDGGVRSVLPVEAAVLAGADRVYAVVASRVEPDPATGLLDGRPIDLAGANFLDIIKHAADDIMPNEVLRSETDPPRGWGIDLTVIRPMADIHDGMTIDPGLIDIRMAEGYMRADDTVQSRGAKPVPGFRSAADQLSTERQTQAIVGLRRAIWEKEGGLDAAGLYPPTTPPSLRALPPTDRLAAIRDMKREVRDLVRRRIAAGGAVPAHAERWWLDWERHRWTPTQPLWDAAHPLDPPRNLTTAVDPVHPVLDQPALVTVHATDSATGQPVHGRVIVDGAAAGFTNTPFPYVFAPTVRTRIDPRTHAREADDVAPVVHVAADGYQETAVTCAFTATGRTSPPAVSLRSVTFPDRFLRHRNFQGELTPVQSDLDRHDATFRVVHGLAPSAVVGPVVRPLPGRTGGGSGISLESVNFPGRFLCDRDGRLVLAQRPAAPDPAFLRSATFVVQPGLAGSGSSFQAWGSPGRYIRHRDFHLFVETDSANTASFPKDASFTVTPPLTPA